MISFACGGWKAVTRIFFFSLFLCEKTVSTQSMHIVFIILVRMGASAADSTSKSTLQGVCVLVCMCNWMLLPSLV
jgi:hypothetical protein